MIKEQEEQNFEIFQLKRDKNDLLSELQELQEEKVSDLESQISLLKDQLNTAYRQLSDERRQNELQNESNLKHLKMELEIQQAKVDMQAKVSLRFMVDRGGSQDGQGISQEAQSETPAG
jgi:hypothetical protein